MIDTAGTDCNSGNGGKGQVSGKDLGAVCRVKDRTYAK